jgi:sec-independent protein translocase protein TatB
VFNLQGSEIIVILLLALVILGPEKLPDAVRKFAQTYGELKKMGNGFQSELRSVLDEPIREMKETARLVQDAADPKKIAEQAAEDSAVSEAAKSADRAGITDVPITEAALEATDPAYTDASSPHEGLPVTPTATAGSEPAAENEASNNEASDGPPVIVNEIAAANARGPVEPAVPEAPANDVDNVTDQADQPTMAADGAPAEADVIAG